VKGFFTLFCILALCACASFSQPEYSLILSGGTVYSGEDATPIVADIGIVDDRILAIGDLSASQATTRLNVSGLAVTPGFIDIHSHAIRGSRTRSGLLNHPDAENYIRQGVTTAIGGPDGGSWWPISKLLGELEAAPTSINFGTFVGHNTIREEVLQRDNRAPTAKELETMRNMVEQAMQEGAYGLSTGLKYMPGAFSETEEVIELARVAGTYGGIHISHMREEGLQLMDSVAETIRIGEEGNLPTQITHHKVVGHPMWGKSSESLAMVDAARERGVDVSIDQYPYTASSTGIDILLPAWSQAGDRETQLARLADPEARARIKTDVIANIINDRGGNDPARVVLADCQWNDSLNGKSLADILHDRNIEKSIENAAELVMELAENGGCMTVFHAMSEVDVERIMQHPQTMIASDGGIHVPGEGVPHPRNYGTFARIIELYVGEKATLPLHTAVYKMTAMPADRIGLSNRGRLQVGAISDIAVFDPAVLKDNSTFENPHQYASGMKHVFISGQAVILDGSMTGERPGKILRSSDNEN
jgi:N-acyl-D-amino-acid deacylase